MLSLEESLYLRMLLKLVDWRVKKMGEIFLWFCIIGIAVGTGYVWASLDEKGKNKAASAPTLTAKKEVLQDSISLN